VVLEQEVATVNQNAPLDAKDVIRETSLYNVQLDEFLTPPLNTIVMNRPTTHTIRIRACATVAMLLSFVNGARSADLPKPARAFIISHCTECHDAESKKGGLDLTALPAPAR